MIIYIPLLLFLLCCVVEFVVCYRAKARFAKLVLPLLSLPLMPALGEWADQWEGGSMISLVDIVVLVVWCAILLGCLVGWLAERLWSRL